MKINTVLAAVDINDDLAEAVIMAAAEMAQRDKAALHVVDAWPVMSPVALGGTPEMEPGAILMSEANYEADKEAQEDAEKRLKALTHKYDPKAEARLVIGEPADVVARIAKETGADLIVSGSHQKGAWARLFSGSDSASLIREAPCGVFLVTKIFAEKLLAGAKK